MEPQRCQPQSRRCCSPIFRRRRVPGPVSPSPSGNGQSRLVTEHRPPAWGQHGVLYNNQTLMTAFTFRSCWTPRVACDSRSTSHCRSCRLGESRCPRRTTAEWHPDFRPRDLVKQLLLRGCLPRSKMGLIAGFRVRRSLGNTSSFIFVVTMPQLWHVSHDTGMTLA